MGIKEGLSTLLNSLAGRKVEEYTEVYEKLSNLLELGEKFEGYDIVKFCVKCADSGREFPTYNEYIQNKVGLITTEKLDTKGAVLSLLKETCDTIYKSVLNLSVVKAMNLQDGGFENIHKSISDALGRISTADNDTKLLDISPAFYEKKDIGELGIMTGVDVLDRLTKGFQRKTIATIAAYTGQGKSTFTESIVYKNALEGKKCLIVSLELAPEHVWAHFEHRYAYEHGVNTQKIDFQFNCLTDSQAEAVMRLRPQFQKDIASNLAIVDESSFENGASLKLVLTDYDAMNRFLGDISKRLGGLDLVVFDHVNQIELMYPECGNRSVKTMQSSVKTFVDQRGLSPVFIMCCQANREGYKKAMVRGGCYNNTAIGDLNEVERSSSYVIFLYQGEDERNSDITKVTFTKHRLGRSFMEPQDVPFYPEISKVGGGCSFDVSSVDLSDMEFGGADDVF